MSTRAIGAVGSRWFSFFFFVRGNGWLVSTTFLVCFVHAAFSLRIFFIVIGTSIALRIHSSHILCSVLRNWWHWCMVPFITWAACLIDSFSFSDFLYRHFSHRSPHTWGLRKSHWTLSIPRHWFLTPIWTASPGISLIRQSHISLVGQSTYYFRYTHIWKVIRHSQRWIGSCFRTCRHVSSLDHGKFEVTLFGLRFRGILNINCVNTLTILCPSFTFTTFATFSTFTLPFLDQQSFWWCPLLPQFQHTSDDFDCWPFPLLLFFPFPCFPPLFPFPLLPPLNPFPFPLNFPFPFPFPFIITAPTSIGSSCLVSFPLADAIVSIFILLPNLVSRKDMISSLWSSNVFKRALLIWRCRSSSVGQICSNTAIFISSCNFTRAPDGSLRFSYREIRSNQTSKFPVKSSSLDFAGLKMCLNNDPFRLPVAGSYRLLIFLQASIPLPFGQLCTIVKASPSSKFCRTANTCADLSWISSISPAVVAPNSASTSALVMDVSCSSAHVKASSNSGKTDKIKLSVRIFHCRKPSSLLPNLSGFATPRLSINVNFLSFCNAATTCFCDSVIASTNGPKLDSTLIWACCWATWFSRSANVVSLCLLSCSSPVNLWTCVINWFSWLCIWAACCSAISIRLTIPQVVWIAAYSSATIIRKYDPQTHCWCTHFFPWAKMTYVYRVIHVWDVHILNNLGSLL